MPAGPQAHGKIILGEIALKEGDAREAIRILPVEPMAAALDDCTDFMESVGQTVVLYRMDGLMPGVTAQMEVIVRMAELTADAMPRLATMKQLKDYWVEINRLENEGDAIYRGLLRDLFGGAVSDPIEVIKHKDIIERLEMAADAFEKVAHRVESIAIKES